MNEVKLSGVPILRVTSVGEAKGIYCDILGFNLDWEHYYAEGAPVYMQVSRDGLTLHLSENQRFQTGNIVYVATSGIESLHDQLSQATEAWDPPAITSTPWNSKQLEIEDPFKNLLRFNEDDSTGDS